LSSRFGKLEHIEGKNAWKSYSWVRKILTRFTNWITNLLKWCLDHYKTTLAVVLVLFFSSIALVPFGFIGEFFAKSDSGEFLVQIELPKDASLEQSNFMAQKAEAFEHKNM
jgi:HAE1 family hydrophobic/amphiphilic exporter-1